MPLLAIALLFYLIDFIAVLARRFRFGSFSLILAGFLNIFAFFSFTWFFMTDNFALKAVYEQSSRSLPPILKLAASWTGAGGSLLFWSLMMTITLLVFRLKNLGSMNRQQTAASLVMSFFTMTVLAFTLATNPFTQLGHSVPDGLGLNPSLQTTFSMIHPSAGFCSVYHTSAIILTRTWKKLGTDNRTSPLG